MHISLNPPSAPYTLQPGLAPQSILLAISLTIFLQFFGAAIFVSVGNSNLNTKLVKYISDISILNFDAAKVVQADATEFRQAVPAQCMADVLVAYNNALR